MGSETYKPMGFCVSGSIVPDQVGQRLRSLNLNIAVSRGANILLRPQAVFVKYEAQTGRALAGDSQQLLRCQVKLQPVPLP